MAISLRAAIRWLVVFVATHLKNMRSRQIESVPPRIGVKRKTYLKPPPRYGPACLRSSLPVQGFLKGASRG